MRFIARCVIFVGLIAQSPICSAAEIPCAAPAVDQAKKLLAFHFGPDDRMTVDKQVKQLPSLSNPQAPTQKFDVLEVWGHVYKGNYRMRLIYYNARGVSCLLMGQEILEYAKP